VRDLLQVQWLNDDPAKGVEYVYLAEDDYARISGSVKAQLSVLPSGEEGAGAVVWPRQRQASLTLRGCGSPVLCCMPVA
jgi:hypothetical protein